MNTKLTPTFLPLLLTALSIPILCQNNSHYQTCTQPFRCGSLNTLSYPFWGGNRSISCGSPGFELACHSDQPPSITIFSITYRILEINPSSRTLKISRTDLLNNLCPTSPADTTLNFTLFDYYRPADDRNITLYYGCPTFQPPPAAVAVNYMFNCSGFNPNIFNFFITSEDSGRLNGFGDMCQSRINVPVSRDAARDLGNPTLASMFGLRASIEGGFWIEYAADERCDDCVRSGGVCGYDGNTTSFACYCRNGAFGSNCAGSGNGTGNGTCE